MSGRIILLVEDNPDDEELTRLALKKSNVLCEVSVTRDGAETLDFIFGQGQYSGRDITDIPALTLLDMNLPKLNSIDVLRRIRADKRTQLMPVVVLTSSKEDQDLIASYRLGANSYLREPVDFGQYTDTVRQLGLYWLLLNECPSQIVKPT